MINCKRCDHVEVTTRDGVTYCGGVDNLTVDRLTLYTWYRKDKSKVYDAQLYIDVDDIVEVKVVSSAGL